MKIELGKRYERRDGGRSGPINHVGLHGFCIADGSMVWDESGRFLASGIHHADLVKEVEDPQPLEWKRGIPTEEECRECWLIYGGSGDVPTDEGRVYYPNCQQAMWRTSHWYLALRIKPVEPPKPKTKTVTLRKLVHKNGAELWWPHGVLFATFDDWTETDDTKEAEVPA